MRTLRPTTLVRETGATRYQRIFYGNPLPLNRWRYFDAASMDRLFGSLTEIEIWIEASTQTITFGSTTRPASSVLVGYLTRTFYDLLLRHSSSEATSFAPTRINDGICLCFGRKDSDVILIVDAYFGPRKTKRGGDGGDNLTPCRIPAP